MGGSWRGRQIVERLEGFLAAGQIEISRLLVKRVAHHGCVGARHHERLAFAALYLTVVLLADGLADDLVVVNLQHARLVSSLQRVLKVLGDLFLAELLFHAVDDGHDALDVFVEDVAFLQALERNHALLLRRLLRRS